MKKLSAEERLYCTQRVYFWQKVWGVSDWELAVMFGETEGNSRAETMFNYSGRIATITFALHFDAFWTRENLDKTALHEVLEVFFGSARRFIAEDMFDEMVHEWIRTIENKVYPLLSGCST
jgi:hypothetical protein